MAETRLCRVEHFNCPQGLPAVCLQTAGDRGRIRGRNCVRRSGWHPGGGGCCFLFFVGRDDSARRHLSLFVGIFRRQRTGGSPSSVGAAISRPFRFPLFFACVFVGCAALPLFVPSAFAGEGIAPPASLGHPSSVWRGLPDAPLFPFSQGAFAACGRRVSFWAPKKKPKRR